MTDGGTRRHSIAVVPGDGIGPEVTAEALRVLDAAAGAAGFTLDVASFDLGAERFLKSGEVLPDDELAALAGHEAVLLGAVGDPRVEPGVLEEGLLLRLRQELDLYVNLRPSKLFEGVPSVLAGATPEDLDVLIVRENTEGLYSRRRDVTAAGPADAVVELSINTAGAVERIVRYAFEEAARTGRTLTMVHKMNVLRRAGKLWWDTFERLAAEYPGVDRRYQHVDAAALLLPGDPRRFQVIVTDNLFGDILSDLAAALVGGIGWVASGNIHPGRVSVFEPVHGSAPDIAGMGIANPVAAILSAALLLRHVGEDAAAARVEGAVAAAAGKISGADLETRRIGDMIAEAAA